VISALGDERKRKEGGHVPYRDSKLTRLLQVCTVFVKTLCLVVSIICMILYISHSMTDGVMTSMLIIKSIVGIGSMPIILFETIATPILKLVFNKSLLLKM